MTASRGIHHVTAVTADADRNLDFYGYERLISRGIATDAPSRRFGAPVLEFADPDGMRIELAGVAGAAAVANRVRFGGSAGLAPIAAWQAPEVM